MRNERLSKYLMDALTAARNIELETLGLSESLYQNFKIKWFVERGIEIIAEALKRALALDPELPISDAQKIIATRNKIAHEYDIVDHLQLYVIVNKHLKILIRELEELLETK